VRDRLGGGEERDGDMRRAALKALALAGDVAAQLELRADVERELDAGDQSDPSSGLNRCATSTSWRRSGPCSPGSGPRAARMTRCSTASSAPWPPAAPPAALRMYDELIADENPAFAFFWYPRQQLARRMATQTLLAALPAEVAALAAELERRGATLPALGTG
jgi:hypothetical protein